MCEYSVNTVSLCILYQNNMISSSVFGDFSAYECKNPKKPPEGGFWRYVIQIHFKSTGTILIFSTKEIICFSVYVRL